MATRCTSPPPNPLHSSRNVADQDPPLPSSTLSLLPLSRRRRRQGGAHGKRRSDAQPTATPDPVVKIAATIVHSSFHEVNSIGGPPLPFILSSDEAEQPDARRRSQRRPSSGSIPLSKSFSALSSASSTSGFEALCQKKFWPPSLQSFSPTPQSK